MSAGQGNTRDARIESMVNKKTDKEACLKDFYDKILGFQMTPKQIKQKLDEYVIGQEIGKTVLSVQIAFHYKRLADMIEKGMCNKSKNSVKDLEETLKNSKLIKRNIFMIGPTGVGKTYSWETISRLLGRPVVIEDMTKFSATGFVGRDLEEIGIDLLAAAGMNPFLAQVGMVYLDELDKNARTPYTVGKDVNGLEVQYGLLKLVEGTTYAFPVHLLQNTPSDVKEFSTKYVLFAGGGAFEGLKEKVERRMNEFNEANKESGKVYTHWSQALTSDDLVEFGMERQLVGRFPVRVVFDDLTTQDLVNIMQRSADSPLKQYQEDFRSWGFELQVEEGAYGLIAEYAQRQKMGARGIVHTLDKILTPWMYELPGEKANGPIILSEAIVKEALGR